MKLDFEAFKKTVEKEYVLYLATSSENDVTLRSVCPIIIDKTIYFYTGNTTQKYQQMKTNENIAFSIGVNGLYYGQGKVEFLGSVLTDKNKSLKEIYQKKYEGAFEISAPGEDINSNEFIGIHIRVLKEWLFDNENGIPLGLVEEKFF